MHTLAVIKPSILVFTHDDDYFRWLQDRSQNQESRLSKLMLQANTPAAGLLMLHTDPHILIVAVDQCEDMERPDYTKLSLIRCIHSVIRRRRPVITVGPFEPHSFMLGGATRESTRRLLPSVLAELYSFQYAVWSASLNSSSVLVQETPKMPRRGRRRKTALIC